MNKQIKDGAIISYFAILVNIAITLLYTPWMIKQVGVSDYGLYSLVISFLSYFLIDFGLSNTVTRYIAIYRAEGNEEKVGKLMGLVAKFYFLFDCLIFLILLVLFFFLSDIFTGLTTVEQDKLKVLYCIAGSFSILNFVFTPVSGAMSAYEYFVSNKTLDLIQHVSTVLLIIVVLSLNGNIYHLVFINGAAALLVSIVRYIVFKKNSKIKIDWSYFDKDEIKGLASYSGWIFSLRISEVLRISLVPTILGIVSNTTEISIFSVGRNLAGFVFTIATALNGLFLPMVTRLSNQEKTDDILDLMIKVGRIQLFIMMLIFSGFLLFGDFFIQLWVGETFRDAYYVFLFIIFSNLLAHTLTVALDYVYANNNVKPIALRTFWSSLIGLILSLLLARKYGAIGCAVGTGTAMLLTQIQYIVYYNNKMGLNMNKFFRQCHLKIMPLLILFTFIFSLLRRYVIAGSWISLFIWCGIYAIVYCAILFCVLMNDTEKQLIIRLIRVNRSKR